MFDDLVKNPIVMVVVISLTIYGGQRLYLNWAYDKCDGLKLFFIILAIVAIAISVFNDSRWNRRTSGGSNNYQGQNQNRQ